MTEKFQNLKDELRELREFFSPGLAVPLTIGSLTDFWSHPYDNTKIEFWPHLLEGNKADLARREIVASFSPIIADHIGNFGKSAGMMIAATYIGHLVQEYGELTGNKTIEIAGKIIPFAGFLAIVAINILAESVHPNNPQGLGDIIFGVGGAVLAHATTLGLLERIESRNQQLRGVVS